MVAWAAGAWLCTAAQAQNLGFVVPDSLPLSSAPGGLAVADLDDDENIDVLVTDYNVGTLSAFLGDGNGSLFDPISTPANNLPYGVAVADFNRDGSLDAVVSEIESDFVYFLAGRGDGTFSNPVPVDSGHDPTVVSAADMNDDGLMDVVVAIASELGGRVNVLLGNGDGTFLFDTEHQRRLNAPCYGIDVGDFNNDGKLDVAAVTVLDSLSVMLGDGEGNLSRPDPIPTGRGVFGIAAGDVNQDGNLDVVTTDASDNRLGIFYGDGTGLNFTRVVGPIIGVAPATVVLDDLNADGRLDAVVANVVSNGISIAPGAEGGGFGEPRHYVVASRTVDLRVGDFNNDGKRDVVAVSAGMDDPAIAVLLGDGLAMRAIEDVLAVTETPAVSAANVNGDFAVDLVFAVEDEAAVRLLIAETNGFRPAETIATMTPAGALELVDLDGDQQVELLAGSAEMPQLEVLPGRAGGSFGTPTAVSVAGPVLAIAYGHFDRDSNVDVVTVSSTPPAVSVLFGNASGSFDSPSTIELSGGPSDVVSGDFDADGDDDIAVGNGSENKIVVLLSNGNRTFAAPRDVVTTNPPRSISVADLDGDGHLDLASTLSNGSRTQLLYGLGDGNFETGGSINTGLFQSRVLARDVTGDLLPEILVTERRGNVIFMAENRGNRSFAPPIQYTLGSAPMAMTAGDFDDDGRADVAVAGTGGWVLKNELASPIARGDANGDDRRNAVDLLCLIHEMGDGDGALADNVPNGVFASAAGVDANGDGRVDAQDASAIVTRIFRDS